MKSTLQRRDHVRSGVLILLALLIAAVLLFSLAEARSNLLPARAMSSAQVPPSGKPEEPTPDERIATDEWAVRLASGTDADEVAKQFGAENLGQIGTLRSFFLFRFPRPDPQVDALAAEQFDIATAVLLDADSRVEWFEQQVARQQYTRVTITDPLYSAQWHLQNTGQSGGTPGQDVNVVPVWDTGVLGSGVVIGIVDDGLQHSHPDLSPNYVAGASYDFNDDDDDPSPSTSGDCDTSADCHGTSVAGVAAGRDDGSTCGVGAAFRAGLAGLRLIAGPSTDADEAAALTHQYHTIHIFSNSWGPFDDGARLEGPGTLTLAALEDGVTNGRGGRGSIYMWAAGNGLDADDNVNYDGYANSRFTIAVGAIDHNGVQSWYSEPGAPMLVTVPSSGDGVGITTTDLFGADGYSSSNCTDDFGGTSSAAPLASGVVALMLEANPSLTWRDVQHILVETAVQNDPPDTDWLTNGAGHLINHKYGFGRLDAQAAVNAASTWTNVGAANSISSGVINVNQPIPDNNATGVTSTFAVGDNIELEHVEVVFNATHTYRGDLEIVLTSPSGTQSILAEEHGDSGDDYTNWTFMTVRNWGEPSAGTWQLRVADRASSDTGTFDSWSLLLHGTTMGPCTDPPTTPYNPSPAHEATEVYINTDLSWSGGHPCPGESVTYDVYFGLSDPPSTLICDDVSSTTCDPGTLSSDTHYTWQVVANGLNGPSPGPVWNFYTSGEIHILLVDDDKRASYETYYQNALSANGYSFDNWSVISQGSPPSSTLENYNVAIWFTGDDLATTLTDADQANLQAYLDDGGNLFISGQDIGWDLTGNGSVANTFFADYLHASYVKDDVNLYGLNGVSGDPISDGLHLTISGGDGADNQDYPSEIDPLSPAVTVFTYESSSAPPSTTAQETTPKKEKAEPGGNQGLGLQGISSSGSGAIRACTETYKVVYFAFGFEAINSAADRSTVMDRVMTWLSSCGHPDCFGDFDCDCEITTQDIQQVASRWRTTEERYDLNDDGIITIVDIMLVAAHYGETCP
jgi:subtilisin-like proprotein convertase family protein